MFATVSEYLKGLHFPASKDQIVQYAQEHKAPELIVEALEKIPDQQYENAEKAVEEAGKKLI